MPVGDPLAAPLAIRRSLGILDEVGQVFRRLVDVEGGDVFEAGRLAEIHEIDDAPAVGGIAIPVARVGRPAIARADHLLPAVFPVVHHRPAVAEHRDPLIDQPFGDVATHGQSPESAPLAGLQERETQHDRTGLLQLQGKPAGAVVGVRLQREVEALPVVAGHVQPGLGVASRTVPALQRSDQGRRVVGASPDVAFVGSPLDEAHAPAIEALIFDAPFPFPGAEGHAAATASRRTGVPDSGRSSPGRCPGERPATCR